MKATQAGRGEIAKRGQSAVLAEELSTSLHTKAAKCSANAAWSRADCEKHRGRPRVGDRLCALCGKSGSL